MRAVLKLEIIGDNYLQHQRMINQGKAIFPQNIRQWLPVIRYGQKHLRPWVAFITGLDERFVLVRQFISPIMNDYSQANHVGSRGVYAWYALESGIYEVNACVAWGRVRRYFIHVEGTEISEISREEVEQCLIPIG